MRNTFAVGAAGVALALCGLGLPAAALAAQCDFDVASSSPATGAQVAPTSGAFTMTFTTTTTDNVLPQLAEVVTASGAVVDRTEPTGAGGMFSAVFANANHWAATSRSYFVQLLGGGRYYNGPPYICSKGDWPTIAFSVAAPTASAAPAPPAASPAQPAPSAEPLRMILTDAIDYTRQLLRSRIHHVPAGLRYACVRLSSISYRCAMNWTDRRSRWRGLAWFTHARADGDTFAVAYRFLGSRVRRHCARRCTTRLLWEG